MPHPDVDRTMGELGLGLVIKQENGIGQKAAKWLSHTHVIFPISTSIRGHIFFPYSRDIGG